MISQSERQIFITVAEEFRQDVSESWLEGVLAVALNHALAPDEPGQVSLLLADDSTVRQLNWDYRGLDEVTDVLSFSATHQGHWEGEEVPAMEPEPVLGIAPDEAFPGFVLPPDELPPLGEIIISYPQTRRQAEAQGVATERELALLVVHGALHLVGHDHLEPDETARMKSLEQAALAQFFAQPDTSP